MRIMIFGAGVLGSLYAARLQDAGHDVTLLARGQRLRDLRDHGLLLVDEATGRETVTQVGLVEHLAPADAYDWIVVLVRKTQLDTVLPALATNTATPNILLMVNNAAGVEAIASALGRERVVLGFPGAGGMREGRVVRYSLVSGLVQPTTLGELDGQTTQRLRAMRTALRNAGFPTVLSRDMDAWLKTHVAVVSPIANGVYLADGDNYRLARTRDGVVLTVRAIKEGFRVLRKLDIPIMPAKFRLLPLVPEPLLVAVMQWALGTDWATTVIARHANAARDEMQALAGEFGALARLSGVETPALDTLALYLDPSVAPVPESRARIALDWRGVWTLAGGVAALALGLMLYARTRRRGSPGSAPACRDTARPAATSASTLSSPPGSAQGW
jgi:2-dehydropantoate 2-reductase